ncbi:MAG TPA: hypothetical protein VN903_23735, partial [Polyangia bacterium]|nr:hypothetical protein [Polyangia bacterium]
SGAKPEAKVSIPSLGLEDVVLRRYDGSPEWSKLAAALIEIDRYLSKIGGPAEKKEHFARLAPHATPALGEALADVLGRYEPVRSRMREYGGDSELIAYLFLLAQAGHADARVCWQKLVDASPAQLANFFGRAAQQVSGPLGEALVAMVAEALKKKATGSPAVEIASAAGLKYPPIGFWTLTMRVGSSFDVGRDVISLDVFYPADEGGWRVEMRKGSEHHFFPALEEAERKNPVFGPFDPPRVDGLRAFFEGVAKESKIKLSWGTLEVSSNLKKVDNVKDLFGT